MCVQREPPVSPSCLDGSSLLPHLPALVSQTVIRLRALEEASFEGLAPPVPTCSPQAKSSSSLQPRAREAAKPGNEEGRGCVRPGPGAKSTHRLQDRILRSRAGERAQGGCGPALLAQNQGGGGLPRGRVSSSLCRALKGIPNSSFFSRSPRTLLAGAGPGRYASPMSWHRSCSPSL